MKFTLVINKEDEEEIIAKVHSASKLTSDIENLILSYNGEDEIIVQGDYELKRLAISEIDCITVIDRRVYVVDSRAQKYRTGGSLTEMEELLPNYFIRINKSTVANERRISCYKTTFSGGVDAIFRSGYRDYVSRRCFAEIKRRYK